MGIFVFPPHARIPLHNHPGMCVLSRVLYGDVQRLSLDLAPDDVTEKSLDDYRRGGGKVAAEQEETKPGAGGWFNALQRNFGATHLHRAAAPAKARAFLPPGSKRAYRRGPVDRLVAPVCTMLFPYEGNLHEFVAGSDGAAVLDVLLPPYDSGSHRDCTFYTVHDDAEFQSGDVDCDVVQPAGATAVKADGGGGDVDAAAAATTDRPRRHACWIVPTGQPEDFHCISGRFKDMGG